MRYVHFDYAASSVRVISADGDGVSVADQPNVPTRRSPTSAWVKTVPTDRELWRLSQGKEPET